MNRRNFLSSGILAASASLIVPTSVFAYHNSISIFSIGKGFARISDQIKHLSINFLPQNLLKARERLIPILDKKGYSYSNTEVVKLSTNCYAIPLGKTSLMGLNTTELALLIKHNGIFKHYIQNHQISIAFNCLIENFSKSAAANGLNLDTLAFITPNQVINESFGKQSSFTYKNASGNTITLKGSSKKQIAVIC